MKLLKDIHEIHGIDEGPYHTWCAGEAQTEFQFSKPFVDGFFCVLTSDRANSVRADVRIIERPETDEWTLRFDEPIPYGIFVYLFAAVPKGAPRMNNTATFFLFAWNCEANGGWDDLIGQFPSIEDAHQALLKLVDETEAHVLRFDETSGLTLVGKYEYTDWAIGDTGELNSGQKVARRWVHSRHEADGIHFHYWAEEILR